MDGIEEGLSTNDYLIVILSPDSVSSSWVNMELNAALMRELSEHKVCVLPVLHRKCEVPLRLKSKLFVNCSIDYRSGLHTLLERLSPSLLSGFDEMFSEE